jgi:hypothetical protein
VSALTGHPAGGIPSVAGLFDPDGFRATSSDIAALLTFSHQTHMINLLTRASWEARAGSQWDHDHCELCMTKSAMSGSPTHSMRDTHHRSGRTITHTDRLLRHRRKVRREIGFGLLEDFHDRLAIRQRQ